MLKKRFQINIQYAMILCLLFLAAINFDAKFFYFAFGAAIVTMFFLRRIKMNAVSVVYLALGLLMGAFHASLDLMSALRPLAFFLVYLVGYNIPRSFLARKDGKKEQDVTYQLLVTVALGSFAHLMLNFLLNMGNDLGRNTVDIWSGEIMAATGQAALGCIMMGLGAAMVIQPDKKRSRLFGVIVIAGMLLYNLALAGRTLLVILLICLAVGSLYAAAKYIGGRDDMNLVQLVSFGCGVDAITTDEVRSILEDAGKIYTQIKIDEITNLGAVKIRLRSLFAACDAKKREGKA